MLCSLPKLPSLELTAIRMTSQIIQQHDALIPFLLHTLWVVETCLLCLQGTSELATDVKGCPALWLIYQERCILPYIGHECAALAHDCWRCRQGFSPLYFLPALGAHRFSMQAL